jgi:hypothetical protein
MDKYGIIAVFHLLNFDPLLVYNVFLGLIRQNDTINTIYDRVTKN